MKKIFMAIAAMTILIATSCKDSVNAPEDLVPGDGEFLVTIANAPRQEAPTNGKTVKTTIVGSDIFWQNTDEISINGVVYETNKEGSTVIFQSKNGAQAIVDGDSKYKAYYPVEIAPTIDAESNPLPGELPDTIQYNGDNLKNLPMYAESENNVLTFHNICAALKIIVPNLGEGVTCNKIVISANENLAGEFSIETDGNGVPRAVLSTTAAGMSKKVTVTPADENGTFADEVYVALPAGTYTYFAVEFWNGSNLVMRRMLAKRTFEVNNLYNIAFGEFPADMFCFTANGTCTLKFGDPSLLVTTTEGDPYNGWVVFPSGGLELNAGDKVYIKAASTQNYSLSSKSFTSEGGGTLTVSGNIMYLLDPTGCQKDFTPDNENAFNALFQDMSNLVDASGLILPATTLAKRCYISMFRRCSTLTAAPSLPATTLAISCYGSMFRDCSTLTAAPSLPATTLAESCYSNMFFGCTSLTAAPDLHATTLAYECYFCMFNGCSSLGVNTTDMGGTSLVVPSDADNYIRWGKSMFDGCERTGFSGDPEHDGTYYFHEATPQPQN